MSPYCKPAGRDQEKLKSQLNDVAPKQEAIATQITDRILNCQPQIEASNKMLDDLQRQHDEIEASLRMQQMKRPSPPKTFTVNPSMYTAAIGALTAVARAGASEHDDVQRHFNFLRKLVPKAVIAQSGGGKSAELTVHGRLAAILASIKAVDEHTAQKRGAFHAEFTRRVKVREFRTTEEKLDFVTRFHASMSEAGAQWRRLQVSVVAGAGFEPAAFRL